jgi:hypothetical protein
METVRVLFGGLQGRGSFSSRDFLLGLLPVFFVLALWLPLINPDVKGTFSNASFKVCVLCHG